MATPHSTEWWFAQSNGESVGCYIPTWENVMDGVHVVYALGNDGMYIEVAVRTEQSERDPDNSEVTLLVVIARMFHAARIAEAAGRPVRAPGGFRNRLWNNRPAF